MHFIQFLHFMNFHFKAKGKAPRNQKGKGKARRPKREKGKLPKTTRPTKGKAPRPSRAQREKGKARPTTFEIQFHLATRPRACTHERNETISRLSTPQPPRVNMIRRISRPPAANCRCISKVQETAMRALRTHTSKKSA